MAATLYLNHTLDWCWGSCAKHCIKNYSCLRNMLIQKETAALLCGERVEHKPMSMLIMRTALPFCIPLFNLVSKLRRKRLIELKNVFLE